MGRVLCGTEAPARSHAQWGIMHSDAPFTPADRDSARALLQFFRVIFFLKPHPPASLMFSRPLLSLLLLLAALVPAGAQTDWYKDVKYVNEDAYSFSLTFAGVGNMFNKGAKVDGSPATGKIYCVLTQAEYNQILAAGNSGVVWETHKITDVNAPTYRKFFSDKGDGIELPAWLTIGGGVVGLSQRLPHVATAATIASLAVNMINAGAAGHLEKAKGIATKIDSGDEFVRRCALLLKDGKPYAHVVDSLVLMDDSAEKGEVMLSRFIYAVKVG